MLVASEFLLDELTSHLEALLINEHSYWLHLRFVDIYHRIFQNEELQELQKWVNDIVAKHPDEIFDSENFTSLPEIALTSIIKRDDLQMDEGIIWDNIIRWGIAQNSDLPSNPEDWTRENFLTLKTTLQNCLPYIRFFQMSNDDIVDKVKPYKKILDKTLWDDIFKRFLAPRRRVSSMILPPRKIFNPILPSRITDQFPSTVINEFHAAEIAAWVDNRTDTYSVANNPYEFKSLLRGTKDGFTPATFWNLCNKKADTVVVMKVKGTGEILGGYNPTKWDKSINNWKSCNDSFIFSLKTRTVRTSTISRVQNPSFAVGNHPNYGPCFGGGRDLALYGEFDQSNENYCRPSPTYEKPIRNNTGGSSSFCVEEYEVFQLRTKERLV
ncbi:hypothetical protein C2G38_1743339 [Gigaspora rosea]|uniref:TLDc domain-containing protein n=1 Tax=Gigaspora rosea TaxID=44941 RepID=A0A397UT62_9GLOM|nr:hypothetical protein C2G38_1743339 [Gigaspora rosea]